jgi:hypothetical protein
MVRRRDFLTNSQRVSVLCWIISVSEGYNFKQGSQSVSCFAPLRAQSSIVTSGSVMRGDPAVSQRLQQAAEQLRAAIQSARKRRKPRGDEEASPSGKAWQLAPTVMLAPEREEFEAVDEMEEDAGDWQQQRSDEDAGSIGTSLASGSLPHSRT